MFTFRTYEDPARARPHPYVVLAYLDRKAGKVYRDDRDFGFEMAPGNDHFGSLIKLETPSFLSKNGISWKRMERG